MDHEFQMHKYDEGRIPKRSPQECELFSDSISESKEIFTFEK